MPIHPSDANSSRRTSAPDFWETRYTQHDALFGRGPSAFVARHAGWIPPNSDVVDLGAGEARTLIWLARTFGHRPTAVDFSETALATARHRAADQSIALETVTVDLRTWTPVRSWNAVLISFLHLLPDERQHLYGIARQMLRPGGVILAEWFAPTHLDGSHARIGPSQPDRMVAPAELKDAFAAYTLVTCASESVHLLESDVLHGRAGVTRLIAQAAA